MSVMHDMLEPMTKKPSAADQRRVREEVASRSPEDLMPDWGVAPHHARQLDDAGCSMVELIRDGRGKEHFLCDSLRKVRDLLAEFGCDPKMLWDLMQDACCGAEFEPDALWRCFLIGPPPS